MARRTTAIRRLLLAVPALLLALACRAAPAWLPAQVTYSDGTAHSCELQAMGDGALTVKVSSVGRSLPRKVLLSDILEIRQEVEEAQQNQPWMYAESGKNERIALAEESYPFLNFGTVILLASGEVVRGHLISAAFRCREPMGKVGKLFLTRQLKGTPGQTADDLRYPLRIRLTANTPQDAKAITGTLAEAVFGRLERVVAIDLKRAILVEATLSAGNTFSFPPLLDGAYEIYAQTSRFLLAGFPETDEAVPDALERAFRLADDFFNDRNILARNELRTLVWKQRRHFYHDEEHLHGGVMRHLEVWQWHQAGDEWKLDSRLMPFRLKQQGGEADRPLRLVPAFSAVEPGAVLAPEAPGRSLPYPPPRSE